MDCAACMLLAAEGPLSAGSLTLPTSPSWHGPSRYRPRNMSLAICTCKASAQPSCSILSHAPASVNHTHSPVAGSRGGRFKPCRPDLSPACAADDRRGHHAGQRVDFNAAAHHPHSRGAALSQAALEGASLGSCLHCLECWHLRWCASHRGSAVQGAADSSRCRRIDRVLRAALGCDPDCL